MVIYNSKRGRKKGGRTRFKGLMAASRLFAVDPTHLLRVLTGERKNPLLLRRWRDWQRQRENVSAAINGLSTTLQSPQKTHHTHDK